MRRHVRHEPPSMDRFMKYIQLLTENVEQKLSQLLPSKFALIFDGWTADTTHYLAIFATFPKDNEQGYEERLLTLSPMSDEITLCANQHHEFLTYTLHLYNSSWSNVVCLIGDNIQTNKALANKVRLPFLKSATHRFNLAMNDILKAHEQIIDKVTAIMEKLRSYILASKLQKFTQVRPKVINTTRWSSTYDMLWRSTRIRKFLGDLESVEIDSLFLTLSENRRIDTLLGELEQLDSVTKALQNRKTFVSDVRALFDAVIDSYSEIMDRLTSSAAIVHCSAFESAIVKLQRREGDALSRKELSAISVLSSS